MKGNSFKLSMCTVVIWKNGVITNEYLLGTTDLT